MGSNVVRANSTGLRAFRRYSSVWRQGIALTLTAIILVSAPIASAQPTESERETARSLMDEGDRLMAASDFPGALKRYQAAHQIMGVPTTGIEVARTQEKLGLLVEARAIALEVAHSPAAPKEPPVFGEARSQAAELAQQLEGRVPSVVIAVQPPGISPLSAKLDAIRLPEATLGLPVKVNPGEHTLEVTAEGYLPEAVTFTVAEREQRDLVVTLTPGQPTVDADGGSAAAVPSSSSANVTVDEPQSAPSYTATYVAFGIAGVAGLVGGGAGVYSLMKTSDAKKFCDGNSCTESARPLTEDANTYAWVANVGLGVAVLAAGYGVYTLLSQPADTARARSAAEGLALTVGPTRYLDGAAVSWTGAF